MTRGDRIVELLRAGNFLDTAARLVAVDRSTVYDWMGRGRADQSAGKATAFSAFLAAVEEAEAAAEADDVAVIKVAGRHDWKARSWMLERKMPTRWGRRLEVAVQQTRAEAADEFVKFLTAVLPKHLPDEAARRRFIDDVLSWASAKPE